MSKRVASLPPERSGYTAAEVGHMLHLNRETVYLMCKRGELASFHVGRMVRITPESLDDYIARRLREEGQTA